MKEIKIVRGKILGFYVRERTDYLGKKWPIIRWKRVDMAWIWEVFEALISSES
jgi:hypothetical protein